MAGTNRSTVSYTGRDLNIQGGNKGIIVNGPRNLASSETGADLETLGGGNAEHGVCELGLELVEAGLAETAGHVTDDAGDGAADTVVAIPVVGDQVHDPLGSFLIGAAGGEEAVDGLAVDGVDEGEEGGVRAWARVLGGGREEVDVADGAGECDDLDAVSQSQVLLGDGASCNAADGLAGATSSTSAAGLDAVLLEVGPIGVAGPGEAVHSLVAVVLGSLVLIQNEHADWRSEGDAKLGAGLDLDSVLLVAGGCDVALAGATACHLRLDVVFGELHARWAAIDDAAD